jgi:hypothetical protein
MVYWWETRRERDHWEDKDGGGWIIIRWILEREHGGLDWIGLAQDRDKLRAVTSLWFPYNVEKSLSG